MFARYVLASAMFELGLYALAGWWLVRNSWSPVEAAALIVALAIALRLLFVVISFMLARLAGSAYPDGMRTGAGEWLRMLVHEVSVLCALFPVLSGLERWTGTRAPGADMDTREGSPAVLLIHGYICNGAYWWPMIRFLRKHGLRSLYTINLEPVFGSIETYVGPIADRVDSMLEQLGDRSVLIVAHSMGGLAARRYLLSERAHERVIGLVTVGTPHHGTLCACFSPTANAREMRPGSRFLAQIDGKAALPVPVTSIFSYDDNIVLPQLSARLSGARNVPLSGVAHVGLSFSRKVQQVVLEEIGRLQRGDWRADS